MKRFPLMVASAAIGIVMLAGVARSLTAEAAAQTPPDSVQCYHNGWSCSYDNYDGWWSNCDSSAPEGYITTGVAKYICSTWNKQ